MSTNFPYTVLYYLSSTGESPFSKFLDSLEKRQQAKIIRSFHYFKEFGLEAIKKHTKKLTGTPLWELKIVGKDSIRIIYFLPRVKTMRVLHGFVKKKQKIPKGELDLAMQRFQDWKKRST